MQREFLHTRKCLSVALINAIENLRDMERITDLEFRQALQNNEALGIADEYLASDFIPCCCTSTERI